MYFYDDRQLCSYACNYKILILSFIFIKFIVNRPKLNSNSKFAASVCTGKHIPGRSTTCQAPQQEACFVKKAQQQQDVRVAKEAQQQQDVHIAKEAQQQEIRERQHEHQHELNRTKNPHQLSYLNFDFN